MGLDQYAHCTRDPRAEGAFTIPEDLASEQFFYWRKHPDLHGWMRALYYEKKQAQVPVDDPHDGKTHTVMNEEFNAGEGVALTLEDLDALEVMVEGRRLPHTTGFFFGASEPEDQALDRDFIQKARAAIEGGLRVFYTSWW